MTIAWITDLHLEGGSDLDRIVDALRNQPLELILSSGDLCDGELFVDYIRELRERLGVPIYFVLGNHECYGGSIERGREAARTLGEEEGMTYLTEVDGVLLADDLLLIGHDGWVDGREGDYLNSPVQSGDVAEISDFASLRPMERLLRLQELADRAIIEIEERLETAFERCDRVVLLTHIPPCKEAAQYQGRIADSIWGPHFVCRALGDRLRKEMHRRPDQRLLVLCGHAHYVSEVDLLPNLHVSTGFGLSLAPLSWLPRLIAR